MLFVVLRILLLTYITKYVYCVTCPSYCRCLVTNRLRHVQCIRKGLISVDLDVPHTVQWLQLSENSIYELKDNIFESLGLKHIVELNLDKNAIQSIDLNAFSGLTKLKAIDLSYNHLYIIPSALFENIPSLTYVFLQGNPLRNFKRNHPFLISSSIKILDISDCRINFIPEWAFYSLPSLTRLNISSNHIEVIDHHSFIDLHYLKEINLSNNMIVCDSATEEFLTWASFRTISIIGSFCKKSVMKKMEKMVMFDEIENSVSEFENITDSPKTECSCQNCFSKEEVSTEKAIITENTNVTEKTFNNDYITLFLILAFVCGFVIGIAVTTCLWICNRLFRARRKRRLCYRTINYDYSPPAYNELFF